MLSRLMLASFLLLSQHLNTLSASEFSPHHPEHSGLRKKIHLSSLLSLCRIHHIHSLDFSACVPVPHMGDTCVVGGLSLLLQLPCLCSHPPSHLLTHLRKLLNKRFASLPVLFSFLFIHSGLQLL